MKYFLRMQEAVGLNPIENKICFSQSTLFRMECEKLILNY